MLSLFMPYVCGIKQRQYCSTHREKKISLVHDSESDSESLNDLDFIYVLKFSKILSHFGISFVL